MIVCEWREDNKDYFIKSLPSLQEANKWINKNFMRLDNTYSKNPDDFIMHT
jgi:hypothetical protein